MIFGMTSGEMTACLVGGVVLKSHVVQFIVHLFAEFGDGQFVQVPHVGRCPTERVQRLQPPQRSYRSRLHRLLHSYYYYYYRYCYHHRLRGSASAVLTATGFVNGKGQFSTPTESTGICPIAEFTSP